MSDKVSKVDYSKGQIYKICCKDVSIKDEYVGSTTNFRVRKNDHKHSCCNPKCKKYNRKVYQYIRDNGGFDNWDMILVEYYSCNTKKELEARERYWIEELKCSLNSNIPTRESDEYNKHYYQNNKEEIKISKKQYREKNKEKIKENSKQYREDNKEKLKQYKKEYDEKNKEKIKQYYEDNKEKIDNNKSEWYKQNKQRILEKGREIILCECGCEIVKTSIARHKKTKKHITLMENK